MSGWPDVLQWNTMKFFNVSKQNYIAFVLINQLGPDSVLNQNRLIQLMVVVVAFSQLKNFWCFLWLKDIDLRWNKMFAEVSEEQSMEIVKDFYEYILIENTMFSPQILERLILHIMFCPFQNIRIRLLHKSLDIHTALS